MSFLNPFILLGALGIGLPILAHLFNRNEVQETDWGAMQFLDKNIKVRSRQLRLRDIFLLIIRCLAIIFFCLALTRPGWEGTGSSWLSGQQRPGLVIALDASFSMRHGEKESRFQRAIQKVKEITKHCQKGDRVTLVLLAADQRVVVRNMAFEPDRFNAILEAQQPLPEMLNLDSLPNRLRELAEEIDALQKEIYIISDTQAIDWSNLSKPMRDAFEEMGQGHSVFLLPVSGESENCAITELKLISGALRRGTIARYRVSVKNYGNRPAMNVRVVGSIEGSQIDTKFIPSIAPGAEESISLFVPLHNAGAQKISVELPNDVLKEDNIRRTVAVVREKVTVLCVDGSAGDAGALIMASLQARDNPNANDTYSVRSVSWLSFPAQKLDQVDVLILTDVPELTPAQAIQLEQYVRRGNGLIWFAGPNVNVAKWNQHAASKENGLLPASLGQLVETKDSTGTGKPLERSISDHPVLQPLLSLPEDLFNETKYLKRLQVTPHASSATVLNLAASESPVLLEHALGRGHVFMCTTTADPSWNNMAATPILPMLVRQMVNYQASRGFEEAQHVGDTLSLWYISEPDATDAVFESPSGEEFAVPVQKHSNQYVALLDKSQEVGYYMARVSVQAPSVPIAVNVDTKESAVKSIKEADLKEVIKGTGINLVSDHPELVDAINQSRSTKSLWRNLIILALVLLVLEGLIADRMGVKKERVATNTMGEQNA